jgi:hypothetical protein
MEAYYKIFSELADKSIFTCSDWFDITKSYLHRTSLVTVNLLCSQCNIIKTYIGSALSHKQLNANLKQTVYEMVEQADNLDKLEKDLNEIKLCVDNLVVIKMSCPTCGTAYYVFFVIEHTMKPVQNDINRSHGYFRIVKIGEYPNFEQNRLLKFAKYKIKFPSEYNLIIKSFQAYQLKLGTGAIVYLRKAYEVFLFTILDESNIPRPKYFKETLRLADEAKHIIPPELTDKAYGLFGEMSDIVHANVDDDIGLKKYEDLLTIFLLIFDKLIEQQNRQIIIDKLRSN